MKLYHGSKQIIREPIVGGSDIHIYKGTHPRAKAPLIMGHEFIGTIESINGGSEYRYVHV